MGIQDARPFRSAKSHVEALSKSQIYLDYQRAFTRGTGLPLDLHGPQMSRLVSYPREQQDPFCALMAKRRIKSVRRMTSQK